MTAAPTFVARFADGVVTRMTCSTSLSRLDVKRGVALSLATYRSRRQQTAPAIVEARFETADGQVLKSYSADEVAKVRP